MWIWLSPLYNLDAQKPRPNRQYFPLFKPAYSKCCTYVTYPELSGNNFNWLVERMANKQNEILDMLMIMNDRFERMNDRFDTIEKQSNDANARLWKQSNDTNSRLEKLIKGYQWVKREYDRAESSSWSTEDVWWYFWCYVCYPRCRRVGTTSSWIKTIR